MPIIVVATLVSAAFVGQYEGEFAYVLLVVGSLFSLLTWREER